MNCPSCEHELAEGDRFCGACGAVIAFVDDTGNITSILQRTAATTGAIPAVHAGTIAGLAPGAAALVVFRGPGEGSEYLLEGDVVSVGRAEEAEIFLDRCRQLLDGVAEAEAELSAHAGEAIGQLRLNVPVTFGLMHLAPLWPAFMALHPKVTLDVTLSDRIVDLVEEGYDLAVRIARLPGSTLVSRALASTRLILCASPDYLRRHGGPAHPSELARHAVIAYTLASTGDLWTFTGPDGTIEVKVSPRMRTNSGDTCCAAAVRHQGLVLQPSFMVGPHLASGALVEAMPGYRSIELGIHAVYPSRRHLTPKVRALVDFLADAFRTRPWPA